MGGGSKYESLNSRDSINNAYEHGQLVEMSGCDEVESMLRLEGSIQLQRPLYGKLGNLVFTLKSINRSISFPEEEISA